MEADLRAACQAGGVAGFEPWDVHVCQSLPAVVYHVPVLMPIENYPNC